MSSHGVTGSLFANDSHVIAATANGLRYAAGNFYQP